MTADEPSDPARTTLAGTALALLALALSLATLRLWSTLPADGWIAAFGAPETAVEITVHFALLPRIAVALLGGAALGLSGAIFQHVLRNPLAEPTLLGVSAGAQLSLSAATLFAPWLLEQGQDLITIGGAACATAIVFAIAYARSLAPITLVMAGLLVNLLCSSLNAILGVLHWQNLAGVFMWSSGSLVQGDWRIAQHLLPRLAVPALLLCLLARPLSVMSLGDQAAGSLGLPVRSLRLMALALAVTLAGFVVSATGIISFVGLVAPAFARLCGARRISDQLLWAPIIGAALLLLADQAVQWLGLIMPEVPTGIATALIGAPCLLWMLARLRSSNSAARGDEPALSRRVQRPWPAIIVAAALLMIAVGVALGVGRAPTGRLIVSWNDAQNLMQWRWPRVLAALSAGVMLALSGTIMQRMTHNEMASPDVLGLSSGASLCVIAVFITCPGAPREAHVAAAAVGAFVTLAAIIALGRHANFAPERLLLTGVAVGTIFSAFISFLLVSGDPRLGSLLTWMAGSTYRATGEEALIASVIALVSLAVAPFTARWLAILPLGEQLSSSIGVNLAWSRLVLVLVIAVLAGAATLVVGPLSFVGLLAPHVARLVGFQRPVEHMISAAIGGAFVMVVADWLGRNVLFPYQIPAGLLAAIVGGPYFAWTLGRQVRRNF